jgi:hypothetical protein
MGKVFALAKEYIRMPPDEIDLNLRRHGWINNRDQAVGD